MTSTYEKRPMIDIPDSHNACVAGWDAIASRLKKRVDEFPARRVVLAVECYPGVDESDIYQELSQRLDPLQAIATTDAMWPPAKVDRMVDFYLGGNDPVFGYLCPLTLIHWFDAERVADLRRKISDIQGLVLIVGCGATHIASADIVVYANLTRWEAQSRFRRNESSNLGVANHHEEANLQYKRAFFVDWRVADRWKRSLIDRWDYVIDANDRNNYCMASGDVVRAALRHTTTRPFRVVPFFDPAPWGGQWMKDICDLDRQAVNYGWCFDCVPEENSLMFNLGGVAFEVPASDLVFYQPQALLGEAVHARFGDEFPIRFDFLDTMGGGNLSFQVHPLTEYIQQNFGMHYTQDESYYVLDATADASVYLGLQEGVDRRAMENDLREAQNGTSPFPVDNYANRFSARKHDHFLIPAGTCHCSGANTMVLEISATPYIFTFKMWDWGRLGLNGRPRPIHLDHALANLQWDRTTSWVTKNLVNRIVPIGDGPHWREEQTGLHEREFIETRRHWFTGSVPHNTQGTVNVLNLVEGDCVVVESPRDGFAPFVVHYAETFIVPASVGPYTIRPLTKSDGTSYATLKAYVRH